MNSVPFTCNVDSSVLEVFKIVIKMNNVSSDGHHY